jgi:two-component system chemotaxis sensor kinase CheA
MEPSPVQTYLLEAQDLLEQIESITLDGLACTPGQESVNSLFRAFHTIKGSGAMFGFQSVAAFTHHVEGTLDQVRAGRIPISSALLQKVLQAGDHIRRLLAAHEAGQPAPDGSALIADFAALHPGQPVADAALPSRPEREPATVEAAPRSDARARVFKILFRPDPAISINGLDPVSLFQELRLLGSLEVKVLLDRMPGLERLEPERCYLGWELLLRTDRDANAVRDVFIFAEDGAELRIEEVTAQVSGDPAPGAPAPVAPDADKISPAAPAPGTEPGVPSLVGPGRAAGAAKTPARDSLVRVSSERLDRLVSLVGELVMNQSRLNQVAGRIQDADLLPPVEAIERLISELRESVLGIRMTAFGTTLGRFRRLVHDLSRELNKQVEFVTSGEETELDKTVLDQLGDPLVHLVRNSLDHGIESPEERAKAGKPRQGRLELSATHQGADVVVSITDDGRGLNVDAIRARAVERGLIAADANLSENELFGLIFLPGFSTAREVTSVSGRGVGMDVVRRQIESLRGSVQVSSIPGMGTTVSLTLPLTLAIIEGLLVQLGPDQFIIPMSAVTENVELTPADRRAHGQRRAVAVRGDLVPFLRLRDIFDVPEQGPEIEKIVIVRHQGERVGLVVDRVIGTHQTVIQSLNRFCRGVEVVSGTTIMGDGRVALIVDIGGLIRAWQKRRDADGRAA